MQVWNASTLSKLLPTYFGDPNEPLRPIRMAGLPGGIYSAQFVVSSTQAVKDFKATVTALAGEQGAVLPASAVELGYAQWEFWRRSDRTRGRAVRYHRACAANGTSRRNPAVPLGMADPCPATRSLSSRSG